MQFNFLIIFVALFTLENYFQAQLRRNQSITPMILTYNTSNLIFLNTSKLLKCYIPIKFKQKIKISLLTKVC